MRILTALLLILCISTGSFASVKKTRSHGKKTSVAALVKRAPLKSVTTDDLVGFNRYPKQVKALITNALSLADQHLAYKFGSMDPQNNGMDCSGTISYLLKQLEITDVPRQADEIYQWAYENGDFYAVNSHQINSFEFSNMKPGDLLFWSGTYPVKRDPAVTHVMMYLGRDKNNRPLMFGASSRRRSGVMQSGVGVFDFSMPSAKSKARFLGYACIPHLNC